ncbi:type III pantothenate kinase [Palleronia aestuarii]|uniref:Type III pantothenate kinase n=1 Tax=Palleronia aestuarii TaxID=568105 RepID=A0A2W7P2F6_9RHOB|nr:type III pantothenate kinase [Palleronia aestuarii]PZX17622.1 type III pantothenate kinase [Palleronia aestuarii]
MLLTIDCGNTNTVFALWDGKAFLQTWRCATDVQRTADEYYVWLTSLMQLRGLDEVKIDEVVVSSVVPRVVFNLRVLCNRYFDCRPLVVGRSDCALPIPVRIDPGTQVGPDRLANSVAAHDLYGGDLIVVDYGTATNFDIVDRDGAYIGGVLAPGVNLSLQALHEATAALPLVDVTMPPQVVGTNTVNAMQSGVFWGYIGLVSEIVRRIKDECGRPMKVISTGGLAPLFQQGDTLFDVFEDNLTMHGLTVIHRFNRDLHK